MVLFVYNPIIPMQSCCVTVKMCTQTISPTLVLLTLTYLLYSGALPIQLKVLVKNLTIYDFLDVFSPLFFIFGKKILLKTLFSLRNIFYQTSIDIGLIQV